MKSILIDVRNKNLPSEHKRFAEEIIAYLVPSKNYERSSFQPLCINKLTSGNYCSGRLTCHIRNDTMIGFSCPVCRMRGAIHNWRIISGTKSGSTSNQTGIIGVSGAQREPSSQTEGMYILIDIREKNLSYNQKKFAEEIIAYLPPTKKSGSDTFSPSCINKLKSGDSCPGQITCHIHNDEIIIFSCLLCGLRGAIQNWKISSGTRSEEESKQKRIVGVSGRQRGLSLQTEMECIFIDVSEKDLPFNKKKFAEEIIAYLSTTEKSGSDASCPSCINKLLSANSCQGRIEASIESDRTIDLSCPLCGLIGVIYNWKIISEIKTEVTHKRKSIPDIKYKTDFLSVVRLVLKKNEKPLSINDISQKIRDNSKVFGNITNHDVTSVLSGYKDIFYEKRGSFGHTGLATYGLITLGEKKKPVVPTTIKTDDTKNTKYLSELKKIMKSSEPQKHITESMWAKWTSQLASSSFASKTINEIAEKLGLPWPCSRRHETLKKFLPYSLDQLVNIPGFSWDKNNTLIRCIVSTVISSSTLTVKSKAAIELTNDGLSDSQREFIENRVKNILAKKNGEYEGVEILYSSKSAVDKYARKYAKLFTAPHQRTKKKLKTKRNLSPTGHTNSLPPKPYINEALSELLDE